jgi:hypothetical protein
VSLLTNWTRVPGDTVNSLGVTPDAVRVNTFPLPVPPPPLPPPLGGEGLLGAVGFELPPQAPDAAIRAVTDRTTRIAFFIFIQAHLENLKTDN